MNILVSGGFGFLGTTLIERLYSYFGSDTSIHVVDNLSSNPIPHELFLDEIGHPKNLTFSVSDIHDYCLDHPNKTWDYIFHLAAFVGPAGILKHTGQIAIQMIDDTEIIAAYAQKTNAKLLDVSTSEIYGGGQEGLCREDFPRIISHNYSSRLEYAAGKLAAEIALVNKTAVSDLNAVIVRPFNIAGPRQSGQGGFVLPRFIGQALTGRSITVFGDGQQIRAFTHVVDMADGIILAAVNGKSGSAYNIGNVKNKTTIKNLASLVIKHSGSTSKIQFVDPKKLYGPLYEEANDKYPDASRAISELDWFPKYSIEDVIRDSLNYMNKISSETLLDLIGLISEE